MTDEEVAGMSFFALIILIVMAYLAYQISTLPEPKQHEGPTGKSVIAPPPIQSEYTPKAVEPCAVEDGCKG